VFDWRYNCVLAPAALAFWMVYCAAEPREDLARAGRRAPDSL